MANVSGEIISPFACWRCRATLADAAGPGTDQRCRKCGARNVVPTEELARQIGAQASRPSVQQAYEAAGEPAKTRARKSNISA